MSEHKTVLKVTTRTTSASKQRSAFQAVVEPVRTLAGSSLIKEMSEYLHIGTFEAEIMLARLEGFITESLRQGYRLDFNLATFYPKLSNSIPSVDSDPNAHAKPMAAVKGRKALRNLIKDSIIFKNSEVATREVKFYVWNETRNTERAVHQGDDMRFFATGMKATDFGGDDFVALEVHTAAGSKEVQRAKITSVDTKKEYVHFTFEEPIDAGRNYFIVISSREGKGEKYQARRHRTAVKGV